MLDCQLIRTTQKCTIDAASALNPLTYDIVLLVGHLKLQLQYLLRSVPQPFACGSSLLMLPGLDIRTCDAPLARALLPPLLVSPD